MQRQNTYGSANRLLATLPSQSRQGLIAQCDVVDLEFGSVLREYGQRVECAYFPMAGMVSLVSRLDDGARLEIGMVGNEGMLGTALVFGMETCTEDWVVQGVGSAWRIKASAFSRVLAGDAALRRTLNRYAFVLLSQLGQTAACTHFHGVESRLARWLLLTRDRAQSNSFFLTHEFLAYMLGARRAGVTHAASALRDRGLIRYSRGEVRVLNGAGLEKASCGCYRRATRIYGDAFGASANLFTP
jgi:CRP-like cAMP-binding protein